MATQISLRVDDCFRTTTSKSAIAAICQRDASYAGPACADDDHQLVLGRGHLLHIPDTVLLPIASRINSEFAINIIYQPFL